MATSSPTSSTSEAPGVEPARSIREDQLDRRIERAQENEQDAGDSLEFDFNETPELGPEPDDDHSEAAPEKWSVGDEPSELAPGGDARFGRGEPAPIERGTIPQYAGAASTQRDPLPDDAAYIERISLHSARSFLGLFFVVALGFAALTLIIYAAPSASATLLRQMPLIGPEFAAPTALENMVAIADLQENYQTVKGTHHALVLTGVAKNNSTVSLHTVQIGVHLLDAAQHEVANSAVYCGTTLSPKMIAEMTPHELEFLQKLDPQKAFMLEPDHSAPFLVVFIDPPSGLSSFAVTVSKAQPAVASAGEQTDHRE